MRQMSMGALAWLVLLCVAAGFVVYKVSGTTPFYNNIMELLPEDEQNPALAKLTRRMASGFQDRLVILLQAKTDVQSVVQVRSLQSRLLALPGIRDDVSDTDWRQGLKTSYQPYLAGLLTDSDRQRLATQTSRQLADDGLRQLLSPVAAPRPFAFQNDPFGLGGAWLNQLTAGSNISLYKGHPSLRHDGERWFLLAAQLDVSPFDPLLQHRLTSTLNHFRSEYPETTLLTSGMVFHAAAGTQQAKAEIASVGLGSLLGIVLLVLLVFRSIYPLGIVLIVLAGGCVFALAVSLLVFDRIHLLTLAFGSTLLGVSVDYAFHFLVKAQRLGTGKRARQYIRYALAVGAITSITAYLMQLLTPFPGLRQMAVFSASGLLGAWLTVLFCGEFYSPVRHVAAQRRLEKRSLWLEPLITRVYQRFSIRHTSVGLVLFVLAAGSVMIIWHAGSNDSIASLNTSGRALLAAEQRVQTLLQYPSSNRFFLVEGVTDENLLQRLETLDRRIKNRFPDAKTHSAATYVPSLQQQRKNFQVVREKLYGPERALYKLCERMALDCVAIQQSLVESPEFLTLDKLGDASFAALFPPILTESDTRQSLLTLNVTGADNATLLEMAEQQEGVEFVDQSDNLSRLLARYRYHMSVVLSATLGILALAMVFRYRRRAWRMLLPLPVILVVAMACAAMGGGLTIFHLAALLLVLGMSIDTAVFYLEVGLQGDSWLAATLSSFTSILAFGLLSLSQVPVLQQFGIVVLSGILCCWLIMPLFFPPQYVSLQNKG